MICTFTDFTVQQHLQLPPGFSFFRNQCNIWPHCQWCWKLDTCKCVQNTISKYIIVLHHSCILIFMLENKWFLDILDPFNVLVLNLSISQQKYMYYIYELYSFLYLQQRFSFVSFSPHIKRQKWKKKSLKFCQILIQLFFTKK